MAQQVRQSKIFAAEDYTAVYESFVNANFQAYDFDSIRESMVSYVRNNYAESYNDWVESAEFVALLDVIAMFGHNLAFRVDLNSRNNFLSTAERQDSVLKLADFLGYQPRRNVTASGLLKVNSIKTNEAVIGANGENLGNQEVRFESITSIDNLDNFNTLMNAVFAPTNPFGSPRKQATIGGKVTSFYNLNNAINQINFDITGVAQGSQTSFDIIGLDYNNVQKDFKENTPNPTGAFSVVYQNDGKGVTSDGTGFFVGFKQGSLQFQDFNIDDPISNMTLDVDADNVNNTDVWVQTIDSAGMVVKNWTQVENTSGSNAIYNAIDAGVRDIYAVKTRENNQVSIQFADSAFGNLPKDIIRVWYRTGLNDTYVLRPDDIGTKRINIEYIGDDGNSYTATMSVQLRQSVTNASASESLDDIKTNAPLVYSSQDRMITAQDYNSYLLTQSDIITKLKSVNRTHSGHSRYVDFNDPTGAYTNVRMFATDGTLAKEEKIKQSIPSGLTATTVFDKYFKPLLNDDELINLYYDKYSATFDDLKDDYYVEYAGDATTTTFSYSASGIDAFTTILDTDGVEVTNNYTVSYNTGTRVATITATSGGTPVPTGYRIIIGDLMIWQRPNSDISAGYFINQNVVINRTGATAVTYLKYVKVGSICKFSLNGTDHWARITKIFANGLGVDNSGGQPTGLTASNVGAIQLDAVVPTGAILEKVFPVFNRNFSQGERTQVISYLNRKVPFAVKYDYYNDEWDIIRKDPYPTNYNAAFPTSFTRDYNLTQIDGTVSGNSSLDVYDNNWIIHVEYTNDNGIDKWTITSRVVRYTLSSSQIEFSNLTNEFYLDENSKKKRRDKIDITQISTSNSIAGSFYVYGYEFATDGDKFGLYDNSKVILSLIDNSKDDRPDNPESFTAISGNGLTDLRFEWTHVPAENQLVDPSFTNIIDVFVLTNTYDTEFRSWLTDQRNDLSEPVPPTVDELNQSFNQNISKKAMSDSIVYRPVGYKVLFGTKAPSNLRAKFRVIKMAGTRYTDNEIKSKVVENINTFFDINNWDFGETFYFTELAAYVHKEMAGIISSFVIVPLGEDSVFGDLFQITPTSDELFIPNVSVEDVDIIQSITQTNIKAG